MSCFVVLHFTSTFATVLIDMLRTYVDASRCCAVPTAALARYTLHDRLTVR